MAIRLYRYVRVTVHVLAGIATTATIFPFVSMPARRKLITRWSQRLLRMLAVHIDVRGNAQTGLPGNVLLVANHISWVDIFVLNALQASRFIAKAELKRWPLVGLLISGCGTLFIHRERRHHTHRINADARTVLAAGDTVAIFPEGTTTDGTSLLRFHGSLLQPIIDAQGHVLPIAIRYVHPDGTTSIAPAYVGELSFLRSFWRVLGERTLIAQVTLTPLLDTATRHRRELALAAETAIRSALSLPDRGPAPGSAPERGDDLPAASR
jgi:1-acyl-sn-glycerol-3-phosphate acyltransferase